MGLPSVVDIRCSSIGIGVCLRSIGLFSPQINCKVIGVVSGHVFWEFGVVVFNGDDELVSEMIGLVGSFEIVKSDDF